MGIVAQLAVLSTTSLLLASGPSPTTWTWGSTAWDVLWVAATDTITREIQLPHPFVVPGSEVISASGRKLVPGEDYLPDYGSSTIRLLHAVHGKTLVFRYRRVPLLARRRYQLRQRPPPGGSVTTDTVAAPFQLPSDDDGGLLLRGTKTVSLSLGTNRDLSLDQSLRLSLRGSLPQGVEVEAVLSDENLPIQPEGTTQELEELDQVKILVRKGGLMATLGDYRLDHAGVQFASFSRKLQGIQLAAQGPPGMASLSMASSRGEFTSVEFLGHDSKQGPYTLVDYLGSTDLTAGGIVVLAGTEHVWVDGEPMTRGADRDYVIDYGQGTLTFTETRLITAESRIVVDFEYSNRKYRRGSYYVQGKVGPPDGRFGATLALAREADDRESPLDTSLGDEERRVLREAGDDPERARMPAWEFVGMGEGDYDTLQVRYYHYREDGSGGYDLLMEYVGSGNGAYRAVGGHFEYWGPGGGDHVVQRVLGVVGLGSYSRETETAFVFRGHGAGSVNVAFATVPQGEGDYRIVGQGEFEYVGPGHGDRTPYRYLPLPGSKQVADLRCEGAVWGGLRLSAEGAWSQADRNLYSGADDNDNGGGAFLATADQTLPETAVGAVRWRGSYRTRQSAFAPLGRTQRADYYREWNVSAQDRGKEEEVGFELAYRPRALLEIVGSLGGLTRTGGMRSRRTSARAKLGQGENRVDYVWTRARVSSPLATSLRHHHQGEVHVRTGRLSPHARVESEEVTGDAADGRGFVSGRTGLAMALGSKSAVDVWWEGRWQKLRPLAEGWVEEFFARSIGQELRLKGGRWGGLGVQFIRREKRYGGRYLEHLQDEGSPLPSPTTTHLGRGDLNLTAPSGGVSVSLDYRARDEEVRRLVEELVPEDEGGGGEYDSTGAWVGSELGTHRRELVPVGDPETVAEITSSMRARIQPERLVGGGPGSFPVTWEGELRAQLSTTSDDRWGVYLVAPRVFLDDAATRRAVLRWRQALRFQARPRALSATFQLERALDRDNRYENRYDRERSTKVSMNVRVSPGPGLTVRGEGRTERETENREGRSFTVRGRGVGVEVQRPSRPGIGGSLGVGWELDSAEETTPGQEADAWGWGWGVSPALSAGSVSGWAGELGWQAWYRDYHGPWEALRTALRRSDRDGLTHTVRGRVDYRISEHTSLNLTYQGTRNPGARFLHQGRMEVRAFF
jgi:hypothetical protein